MSIRASQASIIAAGVEWQGGVGRENPVKSCHSEERRDEESAVPAMRRMCDQLQIPRFARDDNK